MIMGIEQQIQQRMDAYRGNPQKLQQRYQQSQELLDLLALQKLKSEKEAAARQMQMQMQQSPQTVKQQREAELMQMTKDELAANIGKTMQQQQAKSQNNLQRVANQGIATAPAQNMARMAGGGIVGYAAGDLVDADDASISGDPRKRYQELKSRRRGFLSAAEIDELARLEQRFAGEGPKSVPQQIDEAIGKLLQTPTKPRPASEIQTIGRGTASGTIEEMNAEKPAVVPPQPDTRPPVPTEDETDYLDQGIEAPEQETPTGVAALPGINVQQVNVPSPANPAKIQAYKPDNSGDTAGKGLEDLFRKMTQVDPEAQAKKEREQALEFIGYGEAEKEARKKRIDELESIRAKRMDPEALRREKLDAFLRGGANRTGIGSVGAGAAAGAAKVRGLQQQAELGLLGNVMDAETALMKELQGQRKDAYGFGAEAMKQGREDIRSGAKGLGDMSIQSRKEAQAYADQLLKADVATLEAGDRQRKMELDAALTNASNELKGDIAILEGANAAEKNRLTAESNAALRESTDKRYAENSLANVNNYIGKITQEYDKIYTDRITALSTDPRFAGDEEAINAETARLQSERDAVLNASIQELREQQQRLQNFLSGGGTGGFTVRQVSP